MLLTTLRVSLWTKIHPCRLIFSQSHTDAPLSGRIPVPCLRCICLGYFVTNPSGCPSRCPNFSESCSQPLIICTKKYRVAEFMCQDRRPARRNPAEASVVAIRRAIPQAGHYSAYSESPVVALWGRSIKEARQAMAQPKPEPKDPANTKANSSGVTRQGWLALPTPSELAVQRSFFSGLLNLFTPATWPSSA
jgi:hypothetical protein